MLLNSILCYHKAYIKYLNTYLKLIEKDKLKKEHKSETMLFTFHDLEALELELIYIFSVGLRISLTFLFKPLIAWSLLILNCEILPSYVDRVCIFLSA